MISFSNGDKSTSPTVSNCSLNHTISSSKVCSLVETISISLASANPVTTSSNESILPVKVYQPAIKPDSTVTKLTIFVIDNPNKPVFNDMERDVQELLNQQINPQIKSHGGQVDVVRYEEDDSVLYIEMSGGCQGCSSSSATLKNGVETMIYDEFPDIEDIRDVTDHESGENPYYT